jgi:hypothetical protein
MGVFRGMVEKMRKKLQPWKGKNLSSEGVLNSDKIVFEQHAVDGRFWYT